MPNYYKFKKLGEGTYAVIFMAKETEEGSSKIIKAEPTQFSSFVAIKKIKCTEYGRGQEISAIREIKAMKALKHENILLLKDVFIHKSYIHLVLEYIEFDLEMIFKNNTIIIMPGDIKAWLMMLLKAIHECHRRGIMHRDIKPNNLLIKLDGTLKLADFGLARKIANNMTVQAITRWYRPPELLLGSSTYSYACDIWSIGAVFAEMFLRVPFFAAETDIQQLELIFKALGTPGVEDWPLCTKLPNWIELKKTPGIEMSVLFTAAGEDALDLMKKMLIFDPLKRISAFESLQHQYFFNKPFPTSLGNLPVPKKTEE